MKHYYKKNHPQLWMTEIAPEYDKQPYFENPKDDNELYVNAQSKWIETQSNDAWLEMWSIIDLLARKALTIELHKKGLKFKTEKKEQIVLDVITEILERYKKWRGYRIDFIVTQVMLAVRLILYDGEMKEKFEAEFKKFMASEKDEETALIMAQMSVMEEKENG